MHLGEAVSGQLKKVVQCKNIYCTDKSSEHLKAAIYVPHYWNVISKCAAG